MSKPFPMPMPETVHPEVTDKNISFGHLLGQWAGNTGMHGLPNLTRSNSKAKKIMWALLLLAGVGVLVYQVYVIVDKYYSYPSEVRRYSTIELPIEFPAVTFCNVNPALKSMVQQSMDHEKELSKSNESSYSGMMDDMYSDKSYYKENLAYDQVTDSMGATYTFLDFYNSLTLEWKKKIAYPLDTFLAGCYFGSMQCRNSDFTTYLHPLYGHCFTFNAIVANRLIGRNFESLAVGPLNGLTVTLWVDQDEYISQLSKAAGVRILVHERNKMPFPEEGGINAPVGMHSFIGLTKNKFVRLPSPYADNCQSDDVTANMDMNMFSTYTDSSLPNLTYSQSACRHTCIQRKIEETCNCSSPSLPPSQHWNMNTSVFHFCTYGFNTTSNTISSEATCMLRQSSMLYKECKELCKSDCSEVKFSSVASTLTWPSQASEEDTVIEVNLKVPAIRKLFAKMYGKNEKKSFLEKQFVRVTIYFEESLIYHIVSLASYELTNLLCDMGGQVGLWLGLSVLTLFEIVEVFVDLIVLSAVKPTAKAAEKWKRVTLEGKKKSDGLSTSKIGIIPKNTSLTKVDID